jgi:hypothetical protein
MDRTSAKFKTSARQKTSIGKQRFTTNEENQKFLECIMLTTQDGQLKF